MNRMYQFYEFVPMITFWFVCSYILMIVYPRVSAKSAKGTKFFYLNEKEVIIYTHLIDNPQHYFYMILKLCLFAGLITTLNMSEVSAKHK